MARPNIFRAAAVERMSSPERLDMLMRVVSPKAWIPLVVLAAVAAGVVAWSVTSRVEVAARGRGVLARPGSLRAVVAPGRGQVASLKVARGDRVARGQTIATIDQGEL